MKDKRKDEIKFTIENLNYKSKFNFNLPKFTTFNYLLLKIQKLFYPISTNLSLFHLENEIKIEENSYMKLNDLFKNQQNVYLKLLDKNVLPILNKFNSNNNSNTNSNIMKTKEFKAKRMKTIDTDNISEFRTRILSEKEVIYSNNCNRSFSKELECVCKSEEATVLYCRNCNKFRCIFCKEVCLLKHQTIKINYNLPLESYNNYLQIINDMSNETLKEMELHNNSENIIYIESNFVEKISLKTEKIKDKLKSLEILNCKYLKESKFCLNNFKKCFALKENEINNIKTKNAEKTLSNNSYNYKDLKEHFDNFNKDDQFLIEFKENLNEFLSFQHNLKEIDNTYNLIENSLDEALNLIKDLDKFGSCSIKNKLKIIKILNKNDIKSINNSETGSPLESVSDLNSFNRSTDYSHSANMKLPSKHIKSKSTFSPECQKLCNNKLNLEPLKIIEKEASTLINNSKEDKLFDDNVNNKEETAKEKIVESLFLFNEKLEESLKYIKNKNAFDDLNYKKIKILPKITKKLTLNTRSETNSKTPLLKKLSSRILNEKEDQICIIKKKTTKLLISSYERSLDKFNSLIVRSSDPTFLLDIRSRRKPKEEY